MKAEYQQVYDLLLKIPKGKVTTYGAIGKKLDLNPRFVGRILHVNPDAPRVPCHRVVKAGGRLAGGYAMGGNEGQRARLIEEGVRFIHNTQVDPTSIVTSL
jgi:methylated-DNA-[protein]-cysteine S-methyltransferase